MPSPRAAVAPSRVEQVASGAAWILISLAGVVLSGWAFHVPALTSIVPGLATMKANTALAFLLTGLALLRRNHRDLPSYGLGVLAISALTMTEYLSKADLGIDQLLFRDPNSTIDPGRMSQITSVGFMLLGPALALMKAQSETARRMSRGMGLAVACIGAVALLGYSYDTQALYRIRPYASLSLPTAIAFVIAAIGVQCANPTEGLVRQIHAVSAGGSMLRRLLPAALLIPYFLGFMAWVAHEHLGWEMGFSLALLVASVMLSMVLLMLSNAKRLERDELALRESEERFRLVANTAPVMIWMSGPNKLCSYFNQPWLEFTGRTLEAELGNGWAGGVHPEDFQRCMETYVQAFDQHEPFQMEYRLRRNDGEYRWILDIGVPRLNREGSLSGYIGSCIDVTDHKLAEEALADVGRRLIQAQEEERTWIARELHDDINQRVALLAMELEEWDHHLPQSNAIHNQFQRARQQLSDLGKDIQALSHRLHSSKLEYLGLVAAANSFCNELSLQKKVEIEFSQSGVPRSLPREIALCLFRVLQEALQNAVKHSRVRHFRVELSGSSGGIQLSVSDLGVGFDAQEVKTHPGLGLISMRERLQLVGGEFSIRSEPGRGTTVSARVPLRMEAIVAGPARTASRG